MKKLFFLCFIIIALFLLVNSVFVIGEGVYNATGNITIVNNNGNINATLSNTLIITFNDPEEEILPSSGGGSSMFTKDDEEEEEELVIENLEELLSTVTPSELGYDLLSIDKMQAEKTSNFLSTSKLDSGGLTSWIGVVKASSAQDYINELVNKLNNDQADTLSVEHQVEVFKVKTIYANVKNYVFRSRVIIKVTSSKDVTGVRILELVPKTVESSASQLIFTSNKPRVLEEDPLLEWSVPLIRQGETKSFSYYIKGSVSSDDFKTIAVYDKPKPVEEPTAGVVTEPEPEESEPETKAKPKKFSWWWAVIIIVILGGLAGGYFVYKKQIDAKLLLKKKLEPKDLVIRPDLVISYDKIRTVEKFIEVQIRAGKADVEIRQELISAGWDEHAVDVIMHDVHVVDQNIDKVDRFVKTKLDKGVTLEQIKETLINVGWREDVVDLILDDFR